jgi:hypothetical protein
MHLLTQPNPLVKTLFANPMPSAIRCWGVLDGVLAGQIWVDDEEGPGWAILREAAYGTLYFGGRPSAETVRELISDLRRQGEVIAGVWQDDPVLGFLPTDYNYDGLAVDFTERTMGEGLADFLKELPDGLTLRRMDKELLSRSINYESMLTGLVEPGRVLEMVEGVFLMKGDEILAEAVSGPVIRGDVEMGIETYPAHRQHGYATIASAALIQACESKGWKTYWNCAKQNLPSLKLAQKLGYQREQEYRVLAWT